MIHFEARSVQGARGRREDAHLTAEMCLEIARLRTPRVLRLRIRDAVFHLYLERYHLLRAIVPSAKSGQATTMAYVTGAVLGPSHPGGQPVRP
jgi:hypothetical protein